MKKRLVLILATILIGSGLLIGASTLSRYRSAKSLVSAGTTGNAYADLKITTDASYVDGEYAYFKVNVANVDNIDTATSPITGVDINYHLKIENQSGSNATYKVLSPTGEGTDFVSALTTTTRTFTKGTKQNQEYKVLVKGSTPQSEAVNFKVTLVVEQKEK